MPELTMEQMTATMATRQTELSDELARLEADYRAAIEPLRTEQERITGALALLNGTAPARRTRSGSQRPSGGKRADDALNIVKSHPGVTINELAERMGIKQNYLYRVMPGLVEAGKVRKEGRGFHAA